MSDPTIVACADGVWTAVAAAVTSARIYYGGVAGGTPPRQIMMTYRPAGGAVPVNDVGVVLPLRDRDGAQASYRAEHGEPTDIYFMPLGGAIEALVHAPYGGEVTERQPEIIEDDVAIVAAPGGGINVPSDDGIVMDGYSDIAFQIHLLGGQTNAHVNRTVTAIFQASDDLMIGAVRQWVTVSTGYDQGTDTTAASWSSVGLTALDAAIDFENFQHRRIRMNYTFDGAPQADHPGAVVAVERRK